MDIKPDQLDIKQEKQECGPEIGSTELVFETVNLPSKPTQTKSIAMWSNEETKKLIDLYRKFMNDIGPYNRFKRKKDMWIEISSQIPNKSAKQCEERFKTILKRKKKGIMQIVYLSDAKRKVMHMEDEENEINVRKEKLSPEEDENITACNGVQAWSSSDTKHLAGLYKSFINDVGPQKKFVLKKDMWAQIATNFEDKDARQCELRFNTLFKRKKKCLAKSYATKARRKTVDIRPKHSMSGSTYLNNNRIDEVEEDAMNEEDVIKPQEKEERVGGEVDITPTNAENIELFSISETLKEIAAKKEEGKERRHRERMEATANFQNILLQLLHTRKK